MLKRLRRIKTHTINVLSVVAAVAVATLAILPGLLSGGWLVAALVAVAVFNALAHALTRFEQARAAEEARARSRLSVSVQPGEITCAAAADVEPVVADWRPREEAECLAFLTVHRASGQSQVFVDLDDLPEPEGSASILSIGDLLRLEERKGQGEELTEEEEQALAAAQAQMRKALEPLTRGVAAAFSGSPDRRTEEAYRAEVSAYLDDVGAGLAEWLSYAEAREGIGALRLSLVNETDRNYDRVVVEVHLPDAVTAVDPDDVEEPEALPARPRPFGEPEPLPLATFNVPAFEHRIDPPRIEPIDGLEIDNSASVRIRYSPVSLRPGASVPLDPLLLQMHEPPGHVVLGSWSATATNADGRTEGMIKITVTEPRGARLLLARIFEEHDSEDD